MCGVCVVNVCIVYNYLLCVCVFLSTISLHSPQTYKGLLLRRYYAICILYIASTQLGGPFRVHITIAISPLQSLRGWFRPCLVY